MRHLHRQLLVLVALAIMVGGLAGFSQRADAAPATAPARMVAVAHIPSAALMSWGPTYLSANVCCSTWYTFGAIYKSSIGSSESIYVQAAYPTSRSCHWRVFYRTSNSPDYHTVTYTIQYGTGYVNVARAGTMPSDLSRADIQGDCDSYSGTMAGYVKAAI